MRSEGGIKEKTATKGERPGRVMSHEMKEIMRSLLDMSFKGKQNVVSETGGNSWINMSEVELRSKELFR